MKRRAIALWALGGGVAGALVLRLLVPAADSPVMPTPKTSLVPVSKSSVRILCHVNLDGPLDDHVEEHGDHSHKRELWLPLNAVGRRCPVSGELVLEGVKTATLTASESRSAKPREQERLVIALTGLSTGSATLDLLGADGQVRLELSLVPRP